MSGLSWQLHKPNRKETGTDYLTTIVIKCTDNHQSSC